jgi:hypothetical protein
MEAPGETGVKEGPAMRINDISARAEENRDTTGFRGESGSVPIFALGLAAVAGHRSDGIDGGILNEHEIGLTFGEDANRLAGETAILSRAAKEGLAGTGQGQEIAAESSRELFPSALLREPGDGNNPQRRHGRKGSGAQENRDTTGFRGENGSVPILTKAQIRSRKTLIVLQ